MQVCEKQVEEEEIKAEAEVEEECSYEEDPKGGA
jgi:hypothetical protein